MATNEQGPTLSTAPNGVRLLAALVDGLVVLTVVAILPEPVSILLILCLFVAYHTILIYLLQQTLGKALFGLKVVRTLKKPGLWWAFGRASFGYLIVDVMGLGLLVALFNKRHRALHDFVFGSFVEYEGAGRWSLQTFSARLVQFAEKQVAAVDERKKTIAVLGAFWSFWAGLGRELQNLLRAGAPAPSAAPPPAQVLWSNVVTPIAAATVVATGVAVATVPQLSNIADWLLTERYVFSEPRVMSDFETGTAGWKIWGDAQGSSDEPDVEHRALRATDDSAGQTWYWQAPASFLGNKEHLYDRDLVFRLKTDDVSAPYKESDIVLAGSDITLVHDTWRDPGTEWTGYRIRLSETANWVNRSSGKPATRKEFEQVLSNIEVLRIRGEYTSGRDTGWLDDVIIGAKPYMDFRKIDAPASVVQNGPQGELRVTLSGKPRFPVDMIYRPRTCPPGITCNTLTAHYAQAPDKLKFERKEWVWCRGSATEDWLMDFEILFVDAGGTELIAPVATQCVMEN